MQKSMKKKSVFLLAMFLMAGASSTTIGNLSVQDVNCNEYNLDGSCCKCSFRYYANEKTKLCTKVSDFCQTWSEKNGDCHSCYPSYGSPVNGQCSPNPVNLNPQPQPPVSIPPVVTPPRPHVVMDPNCQCHNDNRVCTDCYQGYQLNQNNKCNEIPVSIPDDNCAEYGYFDSKGKWYNKWFKGCKQVCIKCDKGFYLDNKNECKTLPANCQAADVNGKCTDCADNYQVNAQGQCELIPVGVPEDNCAEYGYFDSKGKLHNKWFKGCKQVCIKCDQGYELDNGICTQIQVSVGDPNCLQTNQNGDCCKCIPRTYLDKNKVCQQVSNQCQQWSQTTGECTCCYEGYELKAGECILA